MVHHLFVLAGLFLGIWIYHKFVLPCPDSDHTSKEVSASNLLKSSLVLLPVSFKKAGRHCHSFHVTLPFARSSTGKMCIPFLIDPVEKGGLGLTTEEIGFVQGTVGIIGLTLGGILGGIAVARNGLKQWLWPMVWAISLPDLVYVYLSYIQPDSLYLINICIFIEQFGYGFGFTAYMLYLIYFADGEHKTAHYAICTAFMALGMMIPGMAAGWLQEQMGYTHFFIWIMICCVITFGVTALLKLIRSSARRKVDPTFISACPRKDRRIVALWKESGRVSQICTRWPAHKNIWFFLEFILKHSGTVGKGPLEILKL